MKWIAGVAGAVVCSGLLALAGCGSDNPPNATQTATAPTAAATDSGSNAPGASRAPAETAGATTPAGEKKPAADSTASADEKKPAAGSKASGGGGSDAALAAGSKLPEDKAPDGPVKLADKDYKTLEGGLKYAVLKKGSGAEVKDGDNTEVDYTGWLTNGKKFDSSFDHPEPPFSFPVGAGQVIKGWDQGVKGMKVGETRQLLIPADLAYGDHPRPGGPIGPGATLIFIVHVKAIK